MPRFAANLAYLFAEQPFMARFAAAAAAGFKAVELQYPYDHPAAAVKAELDQHGLIVLGINAPPGRPEAGESGLAAMPGREADFAELFAQALDYAVAIGACQIHCLAGLVAPAQRKLAEATFVRNLTAAAELAGERNLLLLIEPINTIDRPNYFLSRVEQAAEIVTAANRPNLRIQFDFYHAQIMGGDLLRRFEKHLPLIGHVQVAGVPARQEPDRGEVNYPEIFTALDRLGYTGWVGAEYRPRGRTLDGLGWGRAYGLIPTEAGAARL